MFGAALLFFTAALGARAEPMPEWQEGNLREEHLEVGTPAHIELRAFDPFGRPLGYRAEPLPAGCRLENDASGRDGAYLEWTPEVEDVGVHEVTVVASQGSVESTQTLRLVVQRTWQSYLVPGLSYTAYVPNDIDKWGFMHGVAAEFLLFTWLHQNENPGPALGRVYLSIDVLASTKSGVFTNLDVSGGTLLSFEKNPTRSYLLPSYGLEIGGLFAKQLTSTLFHLTPLLGLHLYAGPELTVSLLAGYLVPLRGGEFDELRAFRARLSADLAFW